MWYSEHAAGVGAGACDGACADVCDPRGCCMLSAVVLGRFQMPPDIDGHGELTTTHSAAALGADQAAGTTNSCCWC